MKNKIVGYVIIGIAVLIGIIIWSFNRALTHIINTACSHGAACPMWGTLAFQTNISIVLMALVVLAGLYLVFFGKEERIITKVQVHKIKVKEQITPKEVTVGNYQTVLSKLGDDEKKVLEAVIGAKGTMFQSELVEKTGFTKVKVTRILDKLEGRDIIERKRRGMTNVVLLKH